jgi:glutamate-ammonia-ligase adenylyltransferase
MSFEAERHSGFFRRSLGALQSRPPEQGVARLQALIDAPIDPPRVQALVDEGLARAARASALSVDPSLPAANLGRELRRTRLLLIMALMERDLRGQAPLAEVCRAMSAFAAASTQAALAGAARELTAQFGVPHDALGQPQDLLAVAMGKGGADELNVSSDLDLVFVFRDEGQCQPPPDAPAGRGGPMAASEFMHRVARRAIGLLAEPTADGFVFRVDTRLRPNGDAGPLVVSFAMLEEYFYAQGREWERFAWLKGTVVADSGLAGAQARRRDEQSLAAIVTPFVFRRYLDFRVFGALRSLHAMIRSEVARRDARDAGSIDVKLGRGGIREIEFAAQLFQVVRAGRDPLLRDRRTLATLETLARRGVLPVGDATALARAYDLLRRTEHALQYREDAQTHRLPADAAGRAQVAAMLRLSPEAFEASLEQARADVQRVFDGLLSEADDSGAGGGGAAAAEEGLGEDMSNRLAQLRASSRYRAAREDTRQAVERLLARALAERVDAAAFGRLIDLIEAVTGRPAYLALLSQYPQAMSRVMRLLGLSRWAAEYLTHHPIVLDELLDGQLLEPVDYAGWEQALRAALAAAVTPDGAPDVERQMDLAREAHHAQVFRLLVQDLEGLHSVERLADLLSELADRMLAIGLDCVWRTVPGRHREQPRFAVIAYGKLGGKELGYASDLDLVFLFDDDDERAPQAYATLSQRLANWLSARTRAGQLFEIDLRLRPNGNAGLLVTTLEGFTRYQEDEAWVWEHQALTRARHAAGDAAIGAAFEATRRAVLARPREAAPLRAEVIGMRERMHEGHPNRSERFDLKHDQGGMVDIEFIVQYLVLAHAAVHPELLDNVGNIALLGRAARAGLIDDGLATEVADAYRRLRQQQHQLRLNDASYARVAPQELAAERAAVRALWAAVLG